MKKVLLLVLLVVAGPAAADGLSYNYFQAGYASANIDGDDFTGDIDGDGWFIGGSAALTDNFFMYGDYTSLGLDFDVDYDEFELGIGYNYSLGENTDFVAGLSYIKAEAKAFGMSADDDGYGLRLGLRSKLSDTIEVEGGIEYADTDEGSSTALVAGILFDVSDNIAIGVGAGWDDDVTIYNAGFRFYFGD
jgi:long-subunit fatty acid transport protein